MIAFRSARSICFAVLIVDRLTDTLANEVKAAAHGAISFKSQRTLSSKEREHIRQKNRLPYLGLILDTNKYFYGGNFEATFRTLSCVRNQGNNRHFINFLVHYHGSKIALASHFCLPVAFLVMICCYLKCLRPFLMQLALSLNVLREGLDIFLILRLHHHAGEAFVASKDIKIAQNQSIGIIAGHTSAPEFLNLQRDGLKLSKYKAVALAASTPCKYIFYSMFLQTCFYYTSSVRSMSIDDFPVSNSGLGTTIRVIKPQRDMNKSWRIFSRGCLTPIVLRCVVILFWYINDYFRWVLSTRSSKLRDSFVTGEIFFVATVKSLQRLFGLVSGFFFFRLETADNGWNIRTLPSLSLKNRAELLDKRVFQYSFFIEAILAFHLISLNIQLYDKRVAAIAAFLFIWFGFREIWQNPVLWRKELIGV